MELGLYNSTCKEFIFDIHISYWNETILTKMKFTDSLI